MRRSTVPILLLIFALGLAACGGNAQAAASTQSRGANAGNAGGQGRDGFFANQDPNAPLPLASALAVGTIKLQNTAQDITPDEAKQLIPLWQALQSLMQSDTAAQAEVEGVINQIQSTMNADQVSAIKAMNLKGSDEASVFSQLGFGGPNARGTPAAGGTPRAGGGRFGGGFDGGGGGVFVFRGGGGGFAGGGPGGEFNGGGLPGAGGANGGSSSGNSAAQSQRATAQARFAQFQQLGVNPILVRVVLNYLQTKGG
jgi:hypothetical protein